MEHLQVRGRYGWPKHLDHRYGQIISFRWITRASRPRSVRTHFLGVTRGYFFPHPTTTISSRGAIRAFLLSFCILARSLFSRRVNFNDYISLGARARAQTRTVRESPKMFPWPMAGEVSRGRAKRYFDDSIRSFIEVNRPLTGEILCGNTGMRMRYFLSGCFLCIYSVLISNGSIGNQYGFLSALPLFFFLFFVRKKLSQGIRINSTKNTMHVMS